MPDPTDASVPDLVTIIRAAADQDTCRNTGLMHRAATEIDRLRACVEAADAMRREATGLGPFVQHRKAYDLARAALNAPSEATP